MVNSLANHGYIPRNGRNVTAQNLIDGFVNSVNIEPASTAPIAQIAVSTSSTGNPNTFNLNDLGKHHVIEHDGSLSRNDIYFGDNLSFNQKIWAQTLAFFTSNQITVETASKARLARLAAAKKANPQFNLTASDAGNSVVETALYLTVYGNGTGPATTKFVDVLFQEERIPFKEGFVRRTNAITNDEILNMAARVAAAAGN
jgi:hypothetical protein